MTNEQKLQFFAWTLVAVVMTIAVVGWGSYYDWELLPLSNYQLFPLFGLLAFSIMWSHYIVAAIRHYCNIDRDAVKGYFEATSFVVLGSILLHPSLLIGQLYADGFGLPPGSYKDNYVAPGMSWIVFIGVVSLCVFLAFELRRFYGTRPWWKYVSYASDIAMIGIFYHGLKLGGHLQGGWLLMVWYFYGVSLLASLVYLRLLPKSKPQPSEQ